MRESKNATKNEVLNDRSKIDFIASAGTATRLAALAILIWQ